MGEGRHSGEEGQRDVFVLEQRRKMNCNINQGSEPAKPDTTAIRGLINLAEEREKTINGELKVSESESRTLARIRHKDKDFKHDL